MPKYTKEILADAVANSKSIAGVLRHLGIKLSGGMHKHIKSMIDKYCLDTSHWTGARWNRGLRAPRRQCEQILVKRTGNKKEKSRTLLLAVLDAGVDYKCIRCNISEWRGAFLRLQVEHKNGDCMDNRLENLELLCPNCHTQTITYGIQIKHRGCGGTADASDSYGSLTKKLVSSKLLNSANPAMATPSQAPNGEGVETRQEPPKDN